MGLLRGLFGYNGGGLQLGAEDNPYDAYASAAPGNVPGDLNKRQGLFGGLADSLNNPIFQFGMGLASGATPQEGFGNALQSIYARQKLAQANLTGDIKEYQFAKQQGYEGSFQDWMKEQYQQRQGAVGYGIQGQPVYNEKTGEVGFLQMQNRGGQPIITTPGGLKPLSDDWKVNPKPITEKTDTEIIQRDPFTGQERSRTPMNREEGARERASGKVRGETQTTAEINLPQIETTAANAIRQLDELKIHPGRKDATGPLAGRAPALGGAQADFISRLNQIESGAFVNTYKNDLRGGGQISNIEGEKGTKARARMNRLTKPEDFDAAIEDYKNVIRQDVENARRKAGGGGGSSGRVRKYNPETGAIE